VGGWGGVCTRRGGARPSAPGASQRNTAGLGAKRTTETGVSTISTFSQSPISCHLRPLFDRILIQNRSRCNWRNNDTAASSFLQSGHTHLRADFWVRHVEQSPKPRRNLTVPIETRCGYSMLARHVRQIACLPARTACFINLPDPVPGADTRKGYPIPSFTTARSSQYARRRRRARYGAWRPLFRPTAQVCLRLPKKQHTSSRFFSIC